MSRGKYFQGKFYGERAISGLGAIFLESNFLVGYCPRDNLLRGLLASGAVVWEEIIQRAIIQREIIRGSIIQGLISPTALEPSVEAPYF